MSRGQFLTVKCDDCGNEQVIFSKPAQDVECVVCDTVIAESTGGTARFRSDVVSAAE